MKNIIFDIGSVLIGYRWREMCLEAGWEEDKADKIGREFFDNPIWPDVDAGIVSIEELVSVVVKKYPQWEEEARWFITSGKKMVVERPKVWEAVRKLKEKG